MTVQLLLDEMFHPRIATDLVARGHDAVAVVADPMLRGSSDAELLAYAHAEQRALVTNNVVDFERLRRSRAGEELPAFIYTSDASFPRDRRLLGGLITALAHLCRDDLTLQPGQVLWLQPPARP